MGFSTVNISVDRGGRFSIDRRNSFSGIWRGARGKPIKVFFLGIMSGGTLKLEK